MAVESGKRIPYGAANRRPANRAGRTAAARTSGQNRSDRLAGSGTSTRARRSAPTPPSGPVRRKRVKKSLAQTIRELFYKNPGKLNGGFVATMCVLQVFGLLMLFSASYATALYKFGNIYEYFGPQVLYACVGLVAMWVASYFDYNKLRPMARGLYIICLILLVFVLFMEPIKGCKRWINIEHFPSIQVSEIAKFGLIVMLADWFSRYEKRIEGRLGGIKPGENLYLAVIMPGLFLMPILVLLLLEPHHSAMIIMTCITASIMFVGGALMRWFVCAGVTVGAAFAVLLVTKGGYVQERLQGWLDPFSDMQGSTQQTGQSLYTIGSGGLFGVGIGNSVQKHMWLPEAQNDFIFAILCEELGMVGALVCILLFSMLIVQGIVIARKAPDRFGTLLAIGCIAQIGFQFWFNVGVVTNTIPNTGISLPFFSSGGTSLMLLLGQMGMILSVSRAGNRRQAELKAAREQAKAQQMQAEFEKQQQNPYARFRSGRE